MTNEKPLHVRCAEAMGWRDVRETAKGWIGVAPGVPICPEPVFPYGDESSAGWACTGPLIGIFGLGLSRPSTFVFATGRHGRDAYAPNACAAIAEWVAEWVKDGKPC